MLNTISPATFWPSRRTVIRAAVAIPIATGFWLWMLWPRFSCPGRWPTCTELAGLVLASIAYGAAYGLAYTSLAVLLGIAVKALKPEAATLEPMARALPVAATLFAIQAAVTGAISLAGALPKAWPWWLGAYGAVFQ